jgi:hypothetical protein
MARKRRNNSQLGDQACFCVECGWARRFYPGVIEPPAECPSCAGVVISACPSCGESILSTFAVECDACDATLRGRAVHGVPIRRGKRLPVAAPDQPVVDARSPFGGSC